MNYVNSKYLVKNVFEQKDQQQVQVKMAMPSSALVIMPTGTGKTIVMLRLIAGRLENGLTKHLIIVPRLILIEQHYRTCLNTMRGVSVYMLTSCTPRKFEFLKLVASNPSKQFHII